MNQYKMARDLKPDLQWRFFSQNEKKPIIGSSSAKTTLLAFQHSEGWRQRSACVSREPNSVLLLGLHVPTVKPWTWRGARGPPWWCGILFHAVLCWAMGFPHQLSPCAAAAMAVAPAEQWGQGWSLSGAGGSWVVPVAPLVLTHTVTSCKAGSARQCHLKYLL